MRNWSRFVRIALGRIFPWVRAFQLRPRPIRRKQADRNRFVPRVIARSPLVLPNGLNAAAGAAFADYSLIRSFETPPLAAHATGLVLSSGAPTETSGSLAALLALGRSEKMPPVAGNSINASSDSVKTTGEREAFPAVFNDQIVGPFDGGSAGRRRSPSKAGNDGNGFGAPAGNSGGPFFNGGRNSGGVDSDALSRIRFNNSATAPSSQPNQIQQKTTVTLSVVPVLNSSAGLSFVVTATVRGATSGLTAPTGKVEFIDGQVLGTATLNASGVATMTFSAQSADLAGLTAVYLGDATNAPSSGGVVGMPAGLAGFKKQSTQSTPTQTTGISDRKSTRLNSS